MSIITASHHDFAGGRKQSGLFRRVYDRFVCARQAEAARYVNFYLLRFDDETLETLGYDREALKNNASPSAIF